jgi:hypothetical protein
MSEYIEGTVSAVLDIRNQLATAEKELNAWRDLEASRDNGRQDQRHTNLGRSLSDKVSQLKRKSGLDWP